MDVRRINGYIDLLWLHKLDSVKPLKMLIEVDTIQVSTSILNRIVNGLKQFRHGSMIYFIQ